MEQKKIPDKIIDFHVHLFPDKGFDAIWNAFDKLYGCPVLHRLYYRECIDYLKNRNVGPVVFSNYAHKKGYARGMNEWNRKVLDNTDELYCFAAFHPEDEDSLEYAEEILSHPKVLGFKLHFLIQPFYPYDKKFFPLYELVMSKGRRFLMHIGSGPVGSEFTGVENFKKLLKIYPDLPVNVPHMGGLEYKEFMVLMEEYPNLYLDTAYAFLKDVPGVYDLGTKFIEKFQDRILYGSDFPNIIAPREDEIETLLKYDMPAEVYQKIFFKNGADLISKICKKA